MKDLRARITVSLPADLISRIERRAKSTGSSRSRVVEEWLRAGAQRQGQQALSAQIEAYYGAATGEDRAEDEALALAAMERSPHLDLDE